MHWLTVHALILFLNILSDIFSFSEFEEIETTEERVSSPLYLVFVLVSFFCVLFSVLFSWIS